ncbi:hypothetical protein [Arthrobacter bambusae]|uniref:Uncharacterized protein n=1 Tax=Arthrobacter bambusae TaxID=1338426 RepID=A0AAW8DCK1_9MICC|nr:hypothetical protein [Arthrobacter bambusae]MDP9905513.1 hypothetical protein [Arthrobacter bambusae]MDQ0127405.1 hypothetical protein [Arthrobacter bambusae]MDQ0178747.1 hypothetical protein [Arthrobacter bambusae]
MTADGSGTVELAGAASTDSRSVIESCEGLKPGDRIEARRGGTLYFSGRITELMPQFDLFWATDDQGERRIVEFQEYSVSRVHSDDVAAGVLQRQLL